MRLSLGQTTTCPTPVDPSFKAGCPSGYSLQKVYYVPNSEVTNATASTPGAVPLIAGANDCPSYMCQNGSGEGPLQSTCSSLPMFIQPFPLATIGGGLAALLFLEGAWKLLGVAAIAYGVIGTSFSYQVQPVANAQGGVTCTVMGASSL
jgi:hypothetical protein